MKIKICGIRTLSDANVINAYAPDYTGFVFAPSKRQVTAFEAMKLRKAINAKTECVGVFTDTSPEDIAILFDYGVIQAAQLHGSQNDDFLAKLKSFGVPIIQAIRFGKGDSPSELADYLLYDGANPGSGELFNWDMIPVLEKPWFLAGGINTENIGAALQTKAFCLDVASGAETDEKKDPEKIKKLVETVRNSDK